MVWRPFEVSATTPSEPEPDPRASPRVVDAGVIVLLALGAAFFRSGQLTAAGLFLDDAWAALATRVAGPDQLWIVAVQAPGFAVLLRLWSDAFGFSDLTAQLLPFLLGVAAPPALYAGLRAAAVPVSAACAAGVMLATAPMHVEMSGRVKQYTLDALAGSALVAVVLAVVAQPESRRAWRRLAAVGVGATLCSSPAGIAAAAAGAALWLGRAAWDPTVRGVAWPPTLGLALVVGAWMLAVRRTVNPMLVAYWADHYLDPTRGVAALAGQAWIAVRAVGDGAWPFRVPPPAVVALIATFALAIRRPLAALALAAPVAAALALAAARALPIGTGRTDVFLYPWLATLVALGLYALGPGRLREAAPLLVSVLCLVAAVTGKPPTRYPSEDVAPFVALIERDLGARDVVVLNDGAAFAYPLYSRAPIGVERSILPATGFYPVVDHPAVRRYETAASLPAADGETARLWLVTSHQLARHTEVENELRARGWRLVAHRQRKGARLSLWHADRPRPQ